MRRTAVYTAAFTPPTSPLTAISGTSLLTCQYQGTVRNIGFIDSSPNNFTITRNGNTTQGTFSPFSNADGEWSAYFTGSNGLNDTGGGLIGSTTSTFTVEAFVYMTAAPSGSADHGSLVGLDASFTAVFNYLSFGPDTAKKIRLFWFDGANKTCVGGTVLNLNQWYHIAVVVNSGAISLYVDGVSESLTGTTTITNRSSTSNAFNIGKNGQTQFIGYASNVRISNNARTISVPTSPYTSDGNTLVLALQSNRFQSPATGTSAITWETIGGSVQPFSPFAPSAAYDPSVNGGSGYFDGSGDNLTAPDNAAYDFGSGAFTIEGWARPTTASQLAFAARGQSTGFIGWILSTTNFLASTNGSTWNITITFTSALVANSWNHVAVVRNGDVYTAYLNGVANGTTTVSGSIVAGTAATIIGQRAGQADYSGYIANFRIVKGRAVYTSAFTPPTAPLGATSGGDDPPQGTETSLLTNFTNAGIFDNTGKNNLETVGNAQIDTSVKKYGTGSMEFDGTGDYLSVSGTSDLFVFGTGDFTIECWVYLNSTTGYQSIYDQRPSGSATALTPAIYLDDTSLKYYVNGADRITAGTALSTGTWYHIAVSRSGTSTKMFLDGTQTGSTYTDSNNYINGANRPVLAVDGSNTANNELNGYIDDLRITKGVARYTTTFTPPTAAFPDL